MILFVGHSQQRGVLRQFLSRCSANTNTKTLLFCWKTFAVSSLCEIPQRCSVGFNSGTYSHVKVFRFLFTSCVLGFFGSVFWIIMMLEYFSPGKHPQNILHSCIQTPYCQTPTSAHHCWDCIHCGCPGEAHKKCWTLPQPSKFIVWIYLVWNKNVLPIFIGLLFVIFF